MEGEADRRVRGQSFQKRDVAIGKCLFENRWEVAHRLMIMNAE
jgi:hypothetical protein